MDKSIEEKIKNYRESVKRYVSEDLPRNMDEMDAANVERERLEDIIDQEDRDENVLYQKALERLSKAEAAIKNTKRAAKYSIERLITILKERNKKIATEYMSKNPGQIQLQINSLETEKQRLEFEIIHKEQKISQIQELIGKYAEIGDWERKTELEAKLQSLKSEVSDKRNRQKECLEEIDTCKNFEEEYKRNTELIKSYREIAKAKGIKIELNPEKSTGEKPTGEKPTGEKPTGEKPTGEKPTGEETKFKNPKLTVIFDAKEKAYIVIDNTNNLQIRISLKKIEQDSKYQKYMLEKDSTYEGADLKLAQILKLYDELCKKNGIKTNLEPTYLSSFDPDKTPEERKEHLSKNNITIKYDLSEIKRRGLFKRKERRDIIKNARNQHELGIAEYEKPKSRFALFIQDRLGRFNKSRALEAGKYEEYYVEDKSDTRSEKEKRFQSYKMLKTMKMEKNGDQIITPSEKYRAAVRQQEKIVKKASNDRER